MTYKEFRDWCNDRAADGRWSAGLALSAIDCINDVESKMRFRREKYFQKEYGESIVRVMERWEKKYGNESND